MIYLNNAATTYPKPECVMQAVQACLSDMPVSQFRTGTELRRGDPGSLCRQKIGELLKIKDYERICFTSGATESLNQLIGGLDYQNKQIYTTQIEHNSTLRPLMNRKETRDRPMIIIPCDKNGEIKPDVLETYLKKPGIFFINHCSNVTGQIQNLEKITEICHDHQVLVIADLSQSAGCIPIKVNEWDLDGIAFTGHKGLMGIRGTGGFWCKENLSLTPLKFGGTGRNSAQLIYEEDWEYEVGTQNDPGITALLAGVSYILDKTVEKIYSDECEKMQYVSERLSCIDGITVFSAHDSENQGPVLSFVSDRLKPSDIAYILQNGYDITVRTGLHCAPLIHEALGTQQDGTVRISISSATKKEELDLFLHAMHDIQNA